ncbi:MAG: hypothetical protein CVT89_00580, partial [Candidatus Altiarchaeales archaeon HGW-Altiarchaeales-2]
NDVSTQTTHNITAYLNYDDSSYSDYAQHYSKNDTWQLIQIQKPNVSAEKVINPRYPQPGDDVVYTITVKNFASSLYTIQNITDVLPVNWTECINSNVSHSNATTNAALTSWSVSWDTVTRTCRLSFNNLVPLNQNENIIWTFHTSPNASTLEGTYYEDQPGYCGNTTGDSINCHDTPSDGALPNGVYVMYPMASVQKDGPAKALVNDIVEYTLTIRADYLTSYSLNVKDELPVGFIYQSHTCRYKNNNSDCTLLLSNNNNLITGSFSKLDTGDAIVIKIYALVTGAADQISKNNVYLNYSDHSGAHIKYDHDSKTTVVPYGTFVTNIIKEFSPQSKFCFNGQNATIILRVSTTSNDPRATAYNISVWDNLGNLGYAGNCKYKDSRGNSCSCNPSVTSGRVELNYTNNAILCSDMIKQQKAGEWFEISYDVNASAEGTYPDIGYVKFYDYNNTANISSYPASIYAKNCSIMITKTKISPENITPCADVIFNITIKNLASVTMRNVEFRDIYPLNWQNVSYVCGSGGACQDNGDLLNGTATDLSPGGQYSFTLTLRPNTSANNVLGTINLARVFARNSTSYSDETKLPVEILAQTPNVYKVLNSSNNSGIADYGNNVTLTIKVQNPSQGNMVIKSITDIIPENFTFVTSDYSQNCTYNSATRILNCTLNINRLPGSIFNFSYIISPTSNVSEGIYQLNMWDKANVTTADACGKETTTPSVYSPDILEIRAPHLVISKSANISSLEPGNYVNYTITIENIQTGSKGTAHNITVKDEIPIQFEFISASAAKGGNSLAVNHDCSSSNNLCTFNISVALAPQEVVTMRIKVLAKSVLTDTSTDNYANVTGKYGDNSQMNTTNTTPPAHVTILASPILTITKQEQSSTAEPGQPFSYTIKVSNNYNTTAYNVTVYDNIPGNCTYISNSSSPSADRSWNISNTYYWNKSQLSPHNDWTITLTIKCNSNVTTVNNTVNVSYSDGYQYINNQSNSTGTYNDKVTITKPTVTVTKTRTTPPGNVNIGGTITYTLNVNPEGHANVTLTDKVPNGLIYDSCTSAQGQPTCSHNSTTNITTWNVYSNTSVSFTVTYKVTTYAYPEFNNTVNYTWKDDTGGEYGPNSTTSMPTNVCRPNLTLTITCSRPEIYQGLNEICTITITNNANCSAYNVSVVSDVPVNFKCDQAGGDATGICNANNATWFISQISEYGTKILNYTMTVENDTNVNITTQINANATYWDHYDIIYGQDNYVAPNSTTVKQLPKPNIVIYKDINPFIAQPGENVVYSIIVRNDGNSTISLNNITDILPPNWNGCNTTGIYDQYGGFINSGQYNITQSGDTCIVNFTNLISVSPGKNVTWKFNSSAKPSADKGANNDTPSACYVLANQTVCPDGLAGKVEIVYPTAKVIKQFSTTTAKTGMQVNFTLTFYDMIYDVYNLTFNDTLPYGLKYVSSAFEGNCNGCTLSVSTAPCIEDAGKTCDFINGSIGNMTRGNNGKLTVTVNVTENVSAVNRNTGYISWQDYSGGIVQNDTNDDTLYVPVMPAQTFIEKSFYPENKVCFNAMNLTVKLKVFTLGTDPRAKSYNIKITDTFEGMSYIDGTCIQIYSNGSSRACPSASVMDYGNGTVEFINLGTQKVDDYFIVQFNTKIWTEGMKNDTAIVEYYNASSGGAKFTASTSPAKIGILAKSCSLVAVKS